MENALKETLQRQVAGLELLSAVHLDTKLIGRLRINAGKENTRYIKSFRTGLSFSEFSKENLHFLIIHRMKNKLGQTWSQA